MQYLKQKTLVYGIGAWGYFHALKTQKTLLHFHNYYSFIHSFVCLFGCFFFVCFLQTKYIISSTWLHVMLKREHLWNKPTKADWVRTLPVLHTQMSSAVKPPSHLLTSKQLRWEELPHFGSVAQCATNKRRKHVFPGNPAPVGRGHNLRRQRGFHGGTEDFSLNSGAKFQDFLQHWLSASPRPRPWCCWEGMASERRVCYFEGKVNI